MRSSIAVLLAFFFAGCGADDGRSGIPGVTTGGSDPEAAGPSEMAYTIGRFVEVDGTPFLRSGLGSERDGYSSSGRGEYGATTNVLFYDTEAREGRWLFPQAEQVVLESNELRDSSRVEAFLYVLLESDTNDDGRLGADDAQTLALSDPGGRRLVRLSERATRFRQSVRLADGAVLVLFDDADGVQAVEVGVDDLDIRARVTMPPPPQATS